MYRIESVASFLDKVGVRLTLTVLALNRMLIGVGAVSEFIESKSSFAEIMSGKQERRDALSRAISLASPSDIEEAAQRIKEVMRESKGGMRRQRIAPPAFAANETEIDRQ
ncbi:hypothetical protein D3C77_358790 [compost metagenome]